MKCASSECRDPVRKIAPVMPCATAAPQDSPFPESLTGAYAEEAAPTGKECAPTYPHLFTGPNPTGSIHAAGTCYGYGCR